MIAIYLTVGFFAFWIVVLLVGCMFGLVGVGIYRDRSRIRWLWQSRADGVPVMDGAQAAEKLRRDAFDHGHCGICGALYPQHHAGCGQVAPIAGVALPDGGRSNG